jgi:uncharacterized protein (TIGR02246 family)
LRPVISGIAAELLIRFVVGTYLYYNSVVLQTSKRTRAPILTRNQTMSRFRTHVVFVWAISVVLASMSTADLLAQNRSASSSAAVGTADEQAIRQSAAAFAAAFNRHDAKAVAQMWTADGEYVDEVGQRFQGRAAIEKEYADFFTTHPEVKLRIGVDSVRLLSPTTAIEDGHAVLEPMPDGHPAMGRYTAVDVKQRDGSWLAASVRDSRVELPPANGRLRELAWLVGDWVAEHAGTRAAVTSRWGPAGNFIERQFEVTRDGKATSASTEIIAWDPATQQIRSWTFSSDGGRAEGTWVPQDKVWVVAHSGVMADGTPTAATDLWTHLLGDAIGWRSVQRSAGGTPVKDARDVVFKKGQPAHGAQTGMTQPPH